MFRNRVGIEDKKPIVYYGGVVGSPYGIHTEIKDLLLDFKSNFPDKDESYIRCPSFTSWTKDKLVIKSMVDYDVYEDAIQPDSKIYAQWLQGEFFFFADKTVNITTYPPFLERTDIQGVVGQFDASKWFRSVNPASTLIDGRLNIKQGQSLLYVGFDRPVDLVRVTFPEDALQITSGAMAYKQVGMKNRTLSKLYKNFTQSRANKILIKKIKDFNDL